MPEFVRPHHRAVASVLAKLNAPLLRQACCYFGGGTQLSMKYGEYRESRDIDFLCASRAGYALLRAEVSDRSLGRIVTRPIALAREVRADRDGIRTFMIVDDARIKFEILLEARIELDGDLDPALGVPTLTARHAIAEKLLANTDRGMDDSTLARDLIDLAFVVTRLDKADVEAGLDIAEQSYGSAIRRLLGETIERFRADRTRANRCVAALAIDDTATLRKGLRLLERLAR